jgi:triosephosphate isomerase
MRSQLVVGNWKMNGGLTRNEALLDAIRAQAQPPAGRSVAVCVPFPYLAQARALLEGSAVAWGAQNLSEYASGAYTGEVSGAMLKEFGARYVIVGHSERRQLFGESDGLVAKKALAALDHGLVPIVCVGETLAEREAGVTEAVIGRQWSAVAAALGERLAGVVVAYEPVWAIGTGRTATPEQAQAAHASLRAALASAGVPDVPVLYGGSVKAANAGTLFALPDVDGGLIGGASLDAGEFLAIVGALK